MFPRADLDPIAARIQSRSAWHSRWSRAEDSRAWDPGRWFLYREDNQAPRWRSQHRIELSRRWSVCFSSAESRSLLQDKAPWACTSILSPGRSDGAWQWKGCHNPAWSVSRSKYAAAVCNLESATVNIRQDFLRYKISTSFFLIFFKANAQFWLLSILTSSTLPKPPTPRVATHFRCLMIWSPVRTLLFSQRNSIKFSLSWSSSLLLSSRYSLSLDSRLLLKQSLPSSWDNWWSKHDRLNICWLLGGDKVGDGEISSSRLAIIWRRDKTSLGSSPIDKDLNTFRLGLGSQHEECGRRTQTWWVKRSQKRSSCYFLLHTNFSW